MSLRTLPEIKAFEAPKGYAWDVPSDALARWAAGDKNAQEEAGVINVYDVIGEDPWSGGGFTARRMAGALRSIGQKDVVVRVNSPGGNVFEGFAIYNELRAHKAKVTIEVTGLAASAASLIAMAGDDVVMGRGTFLMIHNSWGMVIGNRNDLRQSADVMAQIDAAQIEIYAAKSGAKPADIEAMMDAETFLSAQDAVARGFADRQGEFAASASSATAAQKAASAKDKLDALLAQTGMPRVERRRLLAEATGGMRDAALTGMHDAAPDTADLLRLLNTITS